MPIVAAFLSGLVFGLGLVVAQMINPGKILDFLDLPGNWDPSLAFVMAGAIPVAAIGYAIARRRSRPVFATAFRLTASTAIDAPLVAGAVIFGIGWGLAGYCPGPAVAALGLGRPSAAIFVAAMLVGMGAYEIVQLIVRRPNTSEA